MSRRVVEALLTLALLLPASLQSAEKPSDKREDSLRPTGPVTITADRTDWQKGGAMVYSGNVRLASDTLELNGDKVEIRQHPGGEYEAKVTGDLAKLRHDGVTGEDGEPEPPITAQAKTLNYDTRSGLIDVVGNATMTRGTDRITGETIRYNVAERRIQAMGGTGGQVKIVIQPPPSKSAAPAKDRGN